MRHRKDTCKLGRNASHRRCLFANMLKALIEEGQIITTLAKAKVLRRHADKMITLAKKNTLASRRQAIAEMMVRYNSLNSKETREAKGGHPLMYNTDRKVIDKLFGELRTRFEERQGGYTRFVRTHNRKGDGAQMALLQYLPE